MCLGRAGTLALALTLALVYLTLYRFGTITIVEFPFHCNAFAFVKRKLYETRIESLLSCHFVYLFV